VSDLSSDAAQALQNALERNLDWIRAHILAPGAREQDIQSYINWLYDRLKDRIPAVPDPDELDRLVKKEVRSLFEREAPNGDRKALFGHVEELEDPSALGFEREIELSEEVRACLRHLQKEARELIIEAFTLTEADLSTKDIRDRLAARLGINRNTLDQRISRALRRIRARMRHRPGWNSP
jgi:DNA-directed RNA polymerase specialized sigma24 family protein